MEMLNQKQKTIAIIIIVAIALVIGYYYINTTKDVYLGYETDNLVENGIIEKEEVIKNIKIHITGAINRNGIVEVEEGSRIDDVIQAAGGISEDADLTDVNLAYKVKDGQKIYIPSVDDKMEEENIIPISSEIDEKIILENNQEEEKEQKININEANITELMTLPGIGEATAAKIVEYRQSNGTFQVIEDIKNVSGIGDAKFNTIKEFISV